MMPGMSPRLRALAGEPLVQLALAGLVIAVAARAMGGDGRVAEDAPTAGPVDRRVVVDDEVRGQLREAFERARGRAPGEAELEAAVTRWLDDEILYREGLARGFDRGDPAVRARVASKMAGVLEQAVVVPEPDEAALRALFATRGQEWARPERIDFTHVFVDGSAVEAERRAAALLDQLRAGADPASLGDRFAGGQRYRGRKPADLAESFGPGFTDGLAGQPPGAWALRRSRRGLHLVRIDRREPGRAADFAAVRLDLRKAWRDDRRAEGLAAAVQEIRRRWTVER